MKLFVWDFHGVLERGNDSAVTEITNIILKSFGYSRQMSTEESELLAGRRWHEYFAYLLPEASLEECKKLQSKCVEMANQQPDLIMKHVRLNDHADHVLNEIHNSPFTQILISNTMPTVLDWYVKSLGVDKYFPSTHRFGVDNHHIQGFTKKECLENFLKDNHFPQGMISIGDSPGDMNLTQLHPQGVGYMYSHPGRTHRPAPCHYKISDLRHVLKEVGA
jgi:phosphoglycolate phosphatase-like HAD superfamily hydrolase